MRYTVTSDFVKISESAGTIQNTSQIYTLEVSAYQSKESDFPWLKVNGQNLATVAHVTTAMTRVKNELDKLDAKNYGDVAIADGQLKFFAKTGDDTPLKTIDLPEELFLDQVRTTFVPTFVFSAASYPNATNPNLDGKPVLVTATQPNSTIIGNAHADSLVNEITITGGANNFIVGGLRDDSIYFE